MPCKFFLLILFASLIIPLYFVKAEENLSLIINEAMVNPLGSDTEFEWLELKNLSNDTQQLANWQLNGTVLPEYSLQPGALVVIARNKASVSNQYSIPTEQILEVELSLVNSGATLTLSADSYQHDFSYTSASEGFSFEYLAGDCGLVVKHPDSNSILAENSDCLSIQPTSTNDLSEYPSLLEISALLPNPDSGAEWVELTNHESFAVDLADWLIKDESNKADTFSAIIASGASTKINLSKVTLNNSGDIVRLVTPNGNQVDLFHYDSTKKGQVLEANPEQTSCEVTITDEEEKIETKQVNFAVKPSPTINLEIPKIYRLK